ncbi:MAG TPA: dihydroorotate dehydrogenase electron transfer subunit, partial [Mesotoga sp.]|nr:dihydroorotate dehydrogenase electron transfer subunit [Mesotoga sp.]
CGPTRMLKALEPFLYKREVEVSLEARMACGIGVCYGCTINTKHGSKRVCLDGPVFKMEEVEWNEM